MIAQALDPVQDRQQPFFPNAIPLGFVSAAIGSHYDRRPNFSINCFFEIRSPVGKSET